MQLSAEPLTDLAKALSLNLDRLSRGDGTPKLVFEDSVGGAVLARKLRDTDLQRVVNAYGLSIETLEFRLGNAIRLDVRADSSNQAISDFVKALDQETDYTLSLTIDKEALVRASLPNVPAEWTVRGYFFESTFARILDQRLIEIEHLLWPSGTGKRALAVVFDGHVQLEGSFLSVVDGSVPAESIDAIAPVPAATSDYAEWLARSVIKTVHWDGKFADLLTPEHMSVRYSQPPSGPLFHKLQERLIDLSLLYLCDLTQEKAGRPTSIYFAKEPVSVPWQNLDAPGSSDFSGSVLRLVEWVYDRDYRDSYLQDRRSLVRENASRVLLAQSDETTRYELFARNAEAIRADANAQWRSFRTKALTDYFRDLAEVEKDATTAAQAYADQTSNLTKALTDSLVAAAAAVVVAVAAAATHPPSAEAVLRVIYGAYGALTFGVAAINVSQFRGRAEALESEFRLRTARIRGILAPERLKNPDAIERASRERFWYWLCWVMTLYVILVGLAALAFVTAPGPLAPLLAQPTTTTVLNTQTTDIARTPAPRLEPPAPTATP